MAVETTTKAKRIIVVPRGLSNHGLPKTPGPVSPEGSVRSYRFGTASPPLSPRSFISLFKSEDSPRAQSVFSAGSTYGGSSPTGTPHFPPVMEIGGFKDDSDIPASSCPNCGNCQPQPPVTAAESNKENENPDEHVSLTSRLANRIKAALVTKRKEEPVVERPRFRQKKATLQKVEVTHWTEM